MPNYVLGWNAGGSVAENTSSGSIGFLDLDIGGFPAAIDNIVVTGPGGATYSVDFNTFEVTVHRRAGLRDGDERSAERLHHLR